MDLSKYSKGNINSQEVFAIFVLTTTKILEI
jgi:hypothetical protein